MALTLSSETLSAIPDRSTAAPPVDATVLPSAPAETFSVPALPEMPVPVVVTASRFDAFTVGVPPTMVKPDPEGVRTTSLMKNVPVVLIRVIASKPPVTLTTAMVPPLTFVPVMPNAAPERT